MFWRYRRGSTMISKPRSAVALLSLSLAAVALTGCTDASSAEGSSSASASGACDPADVQLVGQVRNESNPYEAAWLDGGDAFAESVGLDPVVSVGEGAAAVPSVRHPIRLSETPADYRLPPPGLDEHGDEIRRWLAEPATRRDEERDA